MTIKAPKFKNELEILLTTYGIDIYCGLHSHALSDHIIRWLDEYVRQQHVTKSWKLD